MAWLAKTYSELLESYISDIYFRDKQDEIYHELKEIGTGVSRRYLTGPILYFICNTSVSTITKNYEAAAEKLQISINQINSWTRQTEASR